MKRNLNGIYIKNGEEIEIVSYCWQLAVVFGLAVKTRVFYWNFRKFKNSKIQLLLTQNPATNPDHWLNIVAS